MSQQIYALTTLWLAKNIQRGTAVFSNVTFVDITFAQTFDNIPKITITPQAVTSKIFSTTNKTVTGFRVITNGAVTIGVDWIAITP